MTKHLSFLGILLGLTSLTAKAALAAGIITMPPPNIDTCCVSELAGVPYIAQTFVALGNHSESLQFAGFSLNPSVTSTVFKFRIDIIDGPPGGPVTLLEQSPTFSITPVPHIPVSVDVSQVLFISGHTYAFVIDTVSADDGLGVGQFFGYEALPPDFIEGYPQGQLFGKTSETGDVIADLTGPGWLPQPTDVEFSMEFTDVPEPTAAILLGTSIIIFGSSRRPPRHQTSSPRRAPPPPLAPVSASPW